MVFEPVLGAPVAPAVTASMKRESKPGLRAGHARRLPNGPGLPVELRLRELPLLVGLLEARQEECLVDPSLEDRYAHLHTPRDDFPAVHASLAAELGGRQVDRHVPLSSSSLCRASP